MLVVHILIILHSSTSPYQASVSLVPSLEWVVGAVQSKRLFIFLLGLGLDLGLGHDGHDTWYMIHYTLNTSWPWPSYHTLVWGYHKQPALLVTVPISLLGLGGREGRDRDRDLQFNIKWKKWHTLDITFFILVCLSPDIQYPLSRKNYVIWKNYAIFF